jgi:hypothetical protein
MTHGLSLNAGGAIYNTGTGVSSIIIRNCAAPINYFEAYGNGGFMYINNPQTTVTSTNCGYNHMKSYSMGGFVYGQDLSTFSISTCTMVNITSISSGSMFYSPSSNLNLQISSCSISCFASYNAGQVNTNI